MGGSTATALFFLTLLPLDALQVDVAGGLDARERTFVKDKPCVALGHRHCPLGERVARLRSQRVDPSSWPSSCLEYWIWDGSPVRGPRRSRGMALGRKAPGWCAALGPSTSCVHPWASSGDLQVLLVVVEGLPAATLADWTPPVARHHSALVEVVG